MKKNLRNEKIKKEIIKNKKREIFQRRLELLRKTRNSNKNRALPPKKGSSVNEEPDRRMLGEARSLDYVNLQKLLTLTGCSGRDLDKFILKELVDNGLDACKKCQLGYPAVKVIINRDRIEVRDYGRGMTEEDIRKITDLTKSYSMKTLYKTPSRGVLGNALKCILGIPYALSREFDVECPDYPIQIISKRKEYRIKLQIQDLEEKVTANISTVDIPPMEDQSETAVSLKLPLEMFTEEDEYLDIIRGFALFNPDAYFGILTARNAEGYEPIDGGHKRFTGAPSVLWYTESDFKRLVEATIRDIRSGGKDETLRHFIKQFRGLSSDKIVRKIIGEMQAEEKDIPHVLDLASKDDLIAQLYELCKKYSKEPSLNVLGEIGEEQLRTRIKQIYGELEKFRYKKAKGISTWGIIPVHYFLEVAVAVVPNIEETKVLVGINHSPCLHNPFDRWYLEWTDKKGNEHKEAGMHGLLEKYGIDLKQPVVVVAHLISPDINYTNYGKDGIDVTPFLYSLAENLYKACSFYYGYKRGRRSVFGRTSEARGLLKEELQRRKDLLEEYGEVPESERTTQQGIYYKIRSEMGGEIDMKRDSFIAALRDECILMGGDLSYREKLGITAAERAQLFFRGETYPISWERIEELATKGCDVILVEKEGVCEVIDPYASRRGIALLNSRGFATDYAQQLLKLSKILQGNLFLFTDYDVSGLLIAQKLLTIPRLGVDPQMISRLSLSRRYLEEKYDTKDGMAPKKHLKALPLHLQEEVREKRIEIDAVLAAVGPERLWNYLEEKMLGLAPQRDLTRSIDLAIPLPPDISTPLAKITKYVGSVGAPKREEIKEELKRWKEGFVDVEEVEERVQSDVIEEIRKNEQVQELAKQLNELADSIVKNSQKMIQNNHG